MPLLHWARMPRSRPARTAGEPAASRSPLGRGALPAQVVAFDPGRNVGVAWVDADGVARRLAILTETDVRDLVLPFGARILIGDGTGSHELAAVLRGRGIEPEPVDETGTSLEARLLYFRDHPPAGVARLLPPGMRSPPRIIDDYAAYAIALRWLAARSP